MNIFQTKTTATNRKVNTDSQITCGIFTKSVYLFSLADETGYAINIYTRTFPVLPQYRPGLIICIYARLRLFNKVLNKIIGVIID